MQHPARLVATDPVLEKIDDDTYVFTYTTALDGDCIFAHQTQKGLALSVRPLSG